MSELNALSVIVVMGATGGIGAESCRVLQSLNHQVVALGRNSEKLSALQQELGVTTRLINDGANFTEVEETLSSIKSDLGRIDGIVNCIGSVILKPAHMTSEEEFQGVLRTNLNSAFAVVRGGAKVLEQGGSIVLISSAAARIGLANHEAIAAAKGGIIGLTLSAAATYGSKGIRVNAIAPGLVETPMTKRITANERSKQISLAMHTLGRLGQPSDIAQAIAFLLDSKNSWLSGQILGVDGGLGSLQPQPRV